MRRLVLAAFTVAALAAAPSAAAKSCIRIQAPAVAEVGETVRVVVRVYLPAWRDGRVVKLTPMEQWGGRLHLTASGPNGRTRRLKTVGAGDGTGVARVAFGAAASWRLEAIGWEYAPPTCAPPRVIRVVART